MNFPELPCLPLQALVLDEADRLLEMGFAEEIREVVKMAPTRRQTMLFSGWCRVSHLPCNGFFGPRGEFMRSPKLLGSAGLEGKFTCPVAQTMLLLGKSSSPRQFKAAGEGTGQWLEP